MPDRGSIRSKTMARSTTGRCSWPRLYNARRWRPVSWWAIELAPRAHRQQARRGERMASTPPSPEQTDSFLVSKTFGANDITVVNGGVSDLIVSMAAVRGGHAQQRRFSWRRPNRAHRPWLHRLRRWSRAGRPCGGGWHLRFEQDALGHRAQRSSAGRCQPALQRTAADCTQRPGRQGAVMDAAYYVNLYTSVPGAYSSPMPPIRCALRWMQATASASVWAR